VELLELLKRLRIVEPEKITGMLLAAHIDVEILLTTPNSKIAEALDQCYGTAERLKYYLSTRRIDWTDWAELRV